MMATTGCSVRWIGQDVLALFSSLCYSTSPECPALSARPAVIPSPDALAGAVLDVTSVEKPLVPSLHAYHTRDMW